MKRILSLISNLICSTNIKQYFTRSTHAQTYCFFAAQTENAVVKMASSAEGAKIIRLKTGIRLETLRGGADNSLARPTSRCRRTESIVSLERGLFMCRIASLFLLQRLKGSMSGDARDFNIETRAVIKFFFSCKARR